MARSRAVPPGFKRFNVGSVRAYKYNRLYDAYSEIDIPESESPAHGWYPVLDSGDLGDMVNHAQLTVGAPPGQQPTNEDPHPNLAARNEPATMREMALNPAGKVVGAPDKNKGKRPSDTSP